MASPELNPVSNVPGRAPTSALVAWIVVAFTVVIGGSAICVNLFVDKELKLLRLGAVNVAAIALAILAWRWSWPEARRLLQFGGGAVHITVRQAAILVALMLGFGVLIGAMGAWLSTS